MVSETTVDEADFYATLKRLRDLRAWAVRKKIDAWAFRQALITVMHIDTVTALEGGVERDRLHKFDVQAALEVTKYVRKLK